MEIKIVADKREKRTIIEKCDSAFPRPLSARVDYEEIFSRINAYAVFLGAYENDSVLGYATIYANDTQTRIAFISMIGVVEEAQGKHIGSKLMEKCIFEAQRCGMTRIRLEVLNSNEKAISFYKSWGFEFEERCTDASNYLIKVIEDIK